MAVMLNGLGKKVHASWLRGLRQGFEAMNFFANFFELIGDWIAAAVAGNWPLKRSVLPIFHGHAMGFNEVSDGLQHSQTIFFAVRHKMVQIRGW